MELPHPLRRLPFTGAEVLAGRILAGLNTRIAMPAGLAPRPRHWLPRRLPSSPRPMHPGGSGKAPHPHGTQTGSGVDRRPGQDKAAELGFDVTLTDMGEATTDLLTAAQNLLVVVSTYGEGRDA